MSKNSKTGSTSFAPEPDAVSAGSDDRKNNACAKTTGTDGVRPKRTLKAAIAAAVLFAVIMLGIFAVKNTGVNGAVKKAMNAYVHEDAAQMAALTASDSLWDDDDTQEVLALNFETWISGDRAYFNAKLDAQEIKLSYKVKQKRKLSDDQVRELLNSGTLSEESIQKYFGRVMLVEVEVTAKVKGGSDSESLDRALYFVKDAGKWVLYKFAKT